MKAAVDPYTLLHLELDPELPVDLDHGAPRPDMDSMREVYRGETGKVTDQTDWS